MYIKKINHEHSVLCDWCVFTVHNHFFLSSFAPECESCDMILGGGGGKEKNNPQNVLSILVQHRHICNLVIIISLYLLCKSIIKENPIVKYNCVDLHIIRRCISSLVFCTPRCVSFCRSAHGGWKFPVQWSGSIFGQLYIWWHRWWPELYFATVQLLSPRCWCPLL